MVKKVFLLPLLLFLTLSAVLIFCWFRFGFMYGGGDTGLPTYSPQAGFNINKDIWWDSLAPGIPVAQGLTSVPLMLFLSIPQALGASPVFIQAFLFFILLFLIGYGMYLLALYIFGKDKILLAYAAGIFYVFNPYMMIQIWHRFIHNSMVFVAFLPFLVLTWLWWIRKRDPKFLLLFLLANFLAVYVYGTIAFIVAVWTLLFSITLLEVLVPWKGKETTLKIFFAFLMGLLFWLLTNSWWLIPTFSISPALFATQHTIDDSLSTLISLSAQTILPYTLRLINPFYLYWHADFGNIYHTLLFNLISWIPLLFVFIGFIKGLKKKAYAFWSLLFLIVIFLGKGAAPPFSFPYIFGFSNFFPLGVIRNPFEKLGILLPLVFAILFALGLRWVLMQLDKYIGRFRAYCVLGIIVCFYMSFFWPMFAGKLFGTLDKQNFVEVPKSYTQANDWIKRDLGNTTNSWEGRILHLPLPKSEAVSYNWQYGYNGVEPSAAIFTSLPSIARGLAVPGVSDALSGLSLIFHTPYASNQEVILKMLKDFNIKYIILHKDINWLNGELYSPYETENFLNKWEFLEKAVIFENLTIYKLKTDYFSPKIIISDNVELLKPARKNLFWSWIVSTPSAEMVSALSEEQDKSLINKIDKIIISSERGELSRNFEVPEFHGNLENFNHIRILPTSPFYFLLEIKESLSLIAKSQFEIQQRKIIYAEKRLVEMYKIRRMEESGIISKEKGKKLGDLQIERYRKILIEIFDEVFVPDAVVINGYQADTLDVFLRHLGLLNYIKGGISDQNEKKTIDNLTILITKLLVAKGLIPEHQLKNEDISNQQYNQLYLFSIPLRLNYEVLMNRPETKNIYPNNLSELDFQVDDQRMRMTQEGEQKLMSFGEVQIESGEHSMNILGLPSINLVSSISLMNKVGDVRVSDLGIVEIISGKQDSSYIESNIDPAYGGDSYLISFDFQLLSGIGIRVQVSQDTDQLSSDPDELGLGYNNYYFPGSSASNQWRRFEGNVVLRSNTQKAKLRIQAEPWDDCLTVLGDKKKCADEKVSKTYNQSSRFLIRNINVVRILNNDIFLRADLALVQSASPSGMVLEAQKLSSSQYLGKVRIIRPTWIFFKESFDPGWELSLYNGKEIYRPREHLLANSYANAWVIEKTGDYDFTLNYSPQKFIKIAILFAISGWVIVALILVIRLYFRKVS